MKTSFIIQSYHCTLILTLLLALCSSGKSPNPHEDSGSACVGDECNNDNDHITTLHLRHHKEDTAHYSETSLRANLGAAAVDWLLQLLRPPSTGVKPTGGEFCMHILHVNDQHDRILPINKYAATCRDEQVVKGECFGGAAAIWGAIEARKKELDAAGKVNMVIDNGDEFQGSPFYTFYQGNMTAELLGSLGFIETMAIGNHEFDGGAAGLARFFRNVKKSAHPFPLIAHNIDVSNEPLLQDPDFKDIFYPNGWIIKEKAGKKIALIGITTEKVPLTSAPGPNVIFRDSITLLKELIPKLRKEKKADIVIVVSHSGFERDTEIAKSVPGIDAIIGGHSHTKLVGGHEEAGPDGNKVPIVQAWAFSRYYGEIELCWPEDGGALLRYNASRELVEVKPGHGPDQAAVKKLVDKAKAELHDWMSLKVGEASSNIDGLKATCSTGECPAGRLLAEAFLHSAFAKKNQATMALMNGGGVRAGYTKGDLSFGDVLTVSPFQTPLSICGLSGSELKEALEHGVSQVEYSANDEAVYFTGGAMPQLAGLEVTWNPAKAVGSRIVSTKPKLEDASRYVLIMNQHTRTGGDGYNTFKDKCKPVQDGGPIDADVVKEYIVEKKVVSTDDFPELLHYDPSISVKLRVSKGGGSSAGTVLLEEDDSDDDIPNMGAELVEKTLSESLPSDALENGVVGTRESSFGMEPVYFRDEGKIDEVNRRQKSNRRQKLNRRQKSKAINVAEEN